MGYQSVDQVDQAMRERLNLKRLLKNSAANVQVEMKAYMGLTDDAGDPMMDELLDARLRLARMDITRREAFSKLSDPQSTRGR